LGNEVTSSISLYEIAAIIGALAWLPHIIKMIRAYFSKAEIRIILPKTAEIGFSIFGCIFNTKIAFSTKNKDIVVSEIGIKLKHESGFEKALSWQGITQRLAEFIKDNTTTYPMEKKQSVLAIKLNQKDIEERFIRFQDNSFLENKDSLQIKLIKKISYLQKSEKMSELTSSDEFLDLISFVNHSFIWKAGKYTLEFIIESPEKFILKDYKYSFELTPIDIDTLDKNKKCIEDVVEEVGKVIENPEYKVEDIPYNWVYPSIKKLS